MGGALAVLILLLFLRDIKPTAIIAVSIPGQPAVRRSHDVFQRRHHERHLLAGLALGVGMLVDNSIVVIENIYGCGREGFRRGGSGKRRFPGGGRHHQLHPHHHLRFLPSFHSRDLQQLFTDMGLTIAILIAS